MNNRSLINIYLQGLSFVGRYPINTIESVIETNSKAVVVGEIESASLKYLNEKYPNLDSFISKMQIM